MHDRTCSIPDCSKRSKTPTAELCNMHYERKRLHGTTDSRTPTLEQRLWPRIEFADCWLWQGGLNAAGYGQIGNDRKNLRVHRVVYELLVGPIPDGFVLDHLCRIPRCCNPDHLDVVTQRENYYRGRQGWSRKSGRCMTAGHSLDDAYILPTGRRLCRKCTAIRNARRKRTA